jgi:opacity protein-like surface antigen
MKKIILATTLAFAMLSSAQATDMPDRQLNYLAGVGFTYGGDQLASGTYANNDLRAGKGLVMNVGADFRVSSAFSLQSTIGLHMDAIRASGGSTRTFKRFPVEVLAYFHPTNGFRFGGGARYAGNASTESSYYNGGDYDSKVGGVVEGEFLVNKHVGIKIRYVNEKFTRTTQMYPQGSFETTTKANHFGVITNFYF